MKRKRWVVGIDEVGRGALAGPVTVAAFAFCNASRLGEFPHPPLRDSKKLSPIQRERWVKAIRDWKQRHPKEVFFALAHCAPKTIDSLNISGAANRAATQAAAKVLAHTAVSGFADITLDGGLFLEKMFPGVRRMRTIVRADETFDEVKLASIVAKVARDRKLVSLHARYPRYHFPNHKGYGTKEHLNAIRAHGISSIHRLTFTRRFGTMKEQ